MRPRETVRRRAPIAVVAATAVAAVAAADARPLGAQDGDAPVPAISGLPDAPWATMAMKLEKTIFNVDVLRLVVRVDPGTAGRIEHAVAGRTEYDDDLQTPVAEIALEAPEAVARIEFLRDVSLDQFLDGVDDDMRRARDAGLLTAEGYARVRDGLPEWFGFLEARRIHEGDEIAYHVRGDTIRTVFRGVDGDVLLDQTDVGRQHVLALLGAYFAPKSSFRKGLVRSLWRGAPPE